MSFKINGIPSNGDLPEKKKQKSGSMLGFDFNDSNDLDKIVDQIFDSLSENMPDGLKEILDKESADTNMSIDDLLNEVKKMTSELYKGFDENQLNTLMQSLEQGKFPLAFKVKGNNVSNNNDSELNLCIN